MKVLAVELLCATVSSFMMDERDDLKRIKAQRFSFCVDYGRWVTSSERGDQLVCIMKRECKSVVVHT